MIGLISYVVSKSKNSYVKKKLGCFYTILITARLGYKEKLIVVFGPTIALNSYNNGHTRLFPRMSGLIMDTW